MDIAKEVSVLERSIHTSDENFDIFVTLIISEARETSESKLYFKKFCKKNWDKISSEGATKLINYLNTIVAKNLSLIEIAILRYFSAHNMENEKVVTNNDMFTSWCVNLRILELNSCRLCKLSSAGMRYLIHGLHMRSQNIENLA